MKATTYLIQERHNGIWQTLGQTIYPSNARNMLDKYRTDAENYGGNPWAYRIKVAA